MKNIYKLEITPQAEEGYISIVNYIRARFSEREVGNFVKEFNKKVELIKQNPDGFPASPVDENVRRALVARLLRYTLQLKKVKF